MNFRVRFKLVNQSAVHNVDVFNVNNSASAIMHAVEDVKPPARAGQIFDFVEVSEIAG